MDTKEPNLFYTNLHQKKPPFLEALLFFLVFFLPGYLFQSAQFQITSLFTPAFHLNTFIVILPQMALMLYVLSLRHGERISEYGIDPLKECRIGRIFLTFLGILSLTLLLGAAARALGQLSGTQLSNPAIPQEIPADLSYGAILKRPFVIALILITSLSIGYFEELFFRVYLIGEFGESGTGKIVIILLSSALFAGGHLYQGLIGAAGTFLIGVFLALQYLKRRNWHEIALAHGIYNFVIILLIPAGV